MALPIIWNADWRDRVWSQLDRPWDLIVIGGGITGAGILREAARMGLQVLLVEGQDFASGTSSRSSKLVHGGFRYLKNAQLQVTLQSLRERERLLRDGKGLIERLGFLFAGFEGDRYPLWTIGLGLIIYDLLVLQWRHQYYQPLEFKALCPPVTNPSLRGGYRYFDALTDDARLVFRIIREAVADGGLALTYTSVVSLLRTFRGRVCGVQVQDQASSDRTLEIQAKVVINATGAWGDELRGQLGLTRRLRSLRGSHLVISKDRLPLTRAVTFAHPSDGRPVFAVPWENIILMGTTDVDHPPPIPVDPVISSPEIDYLMEALVHAFPGQALKHRDVQAAYAGVRAVQNTGKANPSQESREHIIWNEEGLVTVSGGKLTTYRLMAMEVLRKLRGILPQIFSTRKSGKILNPIKEIGSIQGSPLDPQSLVRLAGRYGTEVGTLLETISADELQFIPGTKSLWGELRWAARVEAVVHLDDLLLRRVRLGLTLPQGGLEYSQRIQAIVQTELGWDQQRWNLEVEQYQQLLKKSYRIN
jgi:glycerol-3-phosphate dehydrogenase